MRHVLLINSDKMEPIHLLSSDPTVQLSVLTKPKYAPLYAGIAEVWPVDDVANVMQARTAALHLLRSHPLDAIVTPLERSLLTGGFLRSYLDLPGIGYDQMLRFANKLVMKRHLRQAGLRVTPFERLDRLDDLPAAGDRLAWPVVVKPAIGSGSMHTFCIDSADHFRALQAAGQLLPLEQSDVPLLVEHFVPMDAEYHCDGVVFQGEVVFASVSRYSEPALGAFGSVFGSYILDESDAMTQSIQALHRAVVAAFELRDGVTHLEVLSSADGLLIGEITCRPGGGGILKAIRYQYGVELWDAFIRTALGLDPEIAPVHSDGVVGWCGLPCSNGRIVSMTPVETLMQMPEVIDVQMLHQVGERVQEKQTSVFYSGMVFFRTSEAREVPALLDRLRAQYAIELEV
jgi:hypothetical protein